MRHVLKVALPALMATVLVLLPNAAYAQTGSISGQARDGSGAALPGVTVEVTSPALIGTRSTVTDNNGRYQITALPAGTYKITFTLQGFATTSRDNVQVTTDFAANVTGDMKVGDIKEVVDVTAEAPVVDVQNARQQLSLQGEELRDLPTSRNVPSLMALVPGLSSSGFNGNICNGGVGVFCSPIITNFNSHTSAGDPDGLAQGRLLVNGIPINAANTGLITGQSSGYNADIANAQEITFTLSGSLGESETGGASINIIPRTGGNRFAGNFFTSYTSLEWFDRNNGSRRGAQPNLLLNDHDVSGSFGGPIMKDRLWFYSVARHQGKESSQTGGPFYYNLNAGVFAANYDPDIARGPVTYKNLWRNINARLTFQATQRNKFDVFWDEQDTCQDPCDGVVSVFTSPESWWSVQTRPNHLAQVSWTNPLTNKLLLEGIGSAVMQHYDTTRHRYLNNPRNLPRVSELQSDPTKRVNAFAGIPGFDLTSGSILNGELRNIDSYRGRLSASYITGAHNAKVGYDGSWFMEENNQDRNDPRLAYAYNTNQVPTTQCAVAVGGAVSQTQNNCLPPICGTAVGGNTATSNCFPTGANRSAVYCSVQTGEAGVEPNPYGVVFGGPTVTANGTTQNNPFPCGNMSLYNPGDLYNAIGRVPTPTTFTQYTGPRTVNERVTTHAVYVQDQWTVNRFTLNGALRWDNATSEYRPTCLQSDVFIAQPYCAPREPTDGVSFNNITPRWGVAWDVFGTGRTSIKWNMGQYLQAASINGIFVASNPARRTVNSYARSWQDWNGNRIPDCYNQVSAGVPDLPIGTTTNGGVNQLPGTPNWARPHTNLGDYCGPQAAGGDPLRFGLDPVGLELANLGVGFNTTQCGRTEAAVPDAVKAYCAAADQNLISGWDKRRAEWQLGIGIQHELLPRLAAEVTYNRRWYYNQQLTDTLGDGCSLYGTPSNVGTDTADRYGQECVAANLRHVNPDYDFYSVTAPAAGEFPGAELLPNGGGYVVTGLSNKKPGVTLGTIDAVTLTTRQVQVWRGVDTNFVLRARGGLRLSGGTSTGSQYTDNCEIMVDEPNVRVARTGDVSCKIQRPFQTNVRANASYTIPWVDVLTSVVFQYRPGVEMSANYTFLTSQLQWDPASASRATNNTGCVNGIPVTGCLTSGVFGDRATVNLLNAGEKYGEGVRLMDLKFAKNIRFAGKRLNVGVDIYNLFNSDAALGYDNTMNDIVGGVSVPHTTNVTTNGVATPWRTFWTANNLVSPRFARFQVQFDF